MPGYMSGTKRAASTPSISNNTKIFGDMAGNVSTKFAQARWISC